MGWGGVETGWRWSKAGRKRAGASQNTACAHHHLRDGYSRGAGGQSDQRLERCPPLSGAHHALSLGCLRCGFLARVNPELGSIWDVGVGIPQA